MRINLNKCFAAALLAAAIVFLRLYFYPHLENALGLLTFSVFLLLVLSVPVIFILGLVKPRSPTLLKLATFHVAVLIMFLIGSITTGNSDSPGDVFAIIIVNVLMYVVLLELAVIFYIRSRQNNKNLFFASFKPYLKFFCTFMAVLVSGILVWSATVPYTVIPAAEKLAENRPYCIKVSGKLASSVYDFLGFRMYQNRHTYFHALLIINDNGFKLYKNWSYHSGQFEPVSDGVKQGMHLDDDTDCETVPHFVSTIAGVKLFSIIR